MRQEPQDRLARQVLEFQALQVPPEPQALRGTRVTQVPLVQPARRVQPDLKATLVVQQAPQALSDQPVQPDLPVHLAVPPVPPVHKVQPDLPDQPTEGSTHQSQMSPSQIQLMSEQ